jgi:hypothetical protein
VFIRNWILKYKPGKTASGKKGVNGFTVDETVIKKAGSVVIWL